MRRATGLATAVLAALLVAYAMLFVRPVLLALPQEPMFGDQDSPVHIYIEPVGIDLVRDALPLRISSRPFGSGIAPKLTPARPISVLLLQNNGGQPVELRPNQPLSPTTFELDLNDGDVSRYPLDRYRASMLIRGIDGASNGGPVPVRVTVWERLLGFTLQTREEPGANPGELRLNFHLGRNLADRYFALAAYAAMAVLAVSALTIGLLVLLRIRPAETTLIGALGAIVFALPALRNALPGNPPLGVLADLLIFFWAELAAVGAVAMIVVTWIRTTPRP